jgi:hypothetical protein
MINIRLAIRWIVESWNTNIKHTTIYSCFRKSTLISTPITLPTSIIPSGFQDLYNEVIQAGGIRDSMAISNFLHPEGEDKVEETALDQEEILQEVIDEHLGVDQNGIDEDDRIEQPVRTLKEAKEAIHVLIEFTKGQDSLDTADIRALERLKEKMRGIQEEKRQLTLEGWLI